MPDPLFETFLTSHGLYTLHKKECHIIVNNLNFLGSIPQKIASIGYFGASDDETIRMGEIGP